MIRVVCDKCSKELDEPGALVFSPPRDPFESCVKFHICHTCWLKLLKWLGG